MDNFLNILRTIRAAVTRKVRPYRSVLPISSNMGFDRGTPIDRYYIEKFLEENKDFIRGKCLEVGDNRYTKLFGGQKVSKSDVLDIDAKNRKATVFGDVQNLNHVPDKSFDTIIFTQVLGMVPDYFAAVSELCRILKPGGQILFTGSYFSRTMNPESSYWRFTPNGAKFVFGKYFGRDNVVVKTYGNVLVGQYFWMGLAQEELTKEELEYNDSHFPVTVTVRAQK